MEKVRVSRRNVLKGIGAMGVVGALGGPTAVFADDKGDSIKGARRIRWDIITPDPNSITPGGQLSAQTSEGSTITMTGFGTFVQPPSDAVTGVVGGAVTGGGMWTISGGTVPSGSGTYQVTRLVSFTREPHGGLPPDFPDLIASAADAIAGLAVFHIAYSDGSTGNLVFSCMLPGSPEYVLEGITATKDFVDFWKSIEAAQTIFHLLH